MIMRMWAGGACVPLKQVLAFGVKAMASHQNCLGAGGRSACPSWIWIIIFFVLIQYHILSNAHSTTNFTSFDQLNDGRSDLVLESIRQHLRKLNKPPVSSVQSPDGDVIDCVPVRKQPAFDHPLLRHHRLQKAPSGWPGWKAAHNAEAYSDGYSNGIGQLWHENGRCPSATIPVRRTKPEDLLRAAGDSITSIQNYGRKSQTSAVLRPYSPQPQPEASGDGHEHAIAYVGEDEYYGAEASMNVWKPEVEVADEFSLSQLWLLAGSFSGDLNSIEAGWQVSPLLYGDTNPRLFTYWTTDEYQSTGCYNLLCSGFIQLSNTITIGGSISPVSSYEGSQYDLHMLIWKDTRTGHWWMRLGDEHLVGYWPEEIFSHMSGLHGAANRIEWGGEVVNSQAFGQHTSTQMGSGRFPPQGFAKSSYFRNLGFVDATNQLESEFSIKTLAEHPNCYAIQQFYSDDWGNYFYYGGPGFNPDCP